MRTIQQISLRTILSLGVLPLALLIGCAPDHAEDDGHNHGADAGSQHAEDGGAGPDDEHGGEHEEGHVELTEQQFKSAGIEVTKVKGGEVFEVLTLYGNISRNADTVLHVTPRVSGQVRSVVKHLGDNVDTGELMCVIDSVELGDAVSDYLSDRALVEAASETLERVGELYALRLEALVRVSDGAIAVQQRIYDREDALQKKAVSTVRPLLEAEKALQLAKLDKEQKLTELKAERDTRLLELDLVLRTRRIDFAAATNKLRALGLGSDSFEGLNDESPLVSGEYKVLSTGAGVVVTRHVSTGEFVEAGSELFVVENLTSIWFVASAFEEQLRSVGVGQSVNVAVDAFPETRLKGTVSFVGYSVDPTSRSVGVRITLDNERVESWDEELPLRPGMFGRVELETATRQAAIVLPEQALVHEDAGDYVFVQVEPFAFERRDVEVNHVAGDMVEVTSGLEPGEKVAISGTFLLKSAERQAELGGGHSH